MAVGAAAGGGSAGGAPKGLTLVGPPGRRTLLAGPTEVGGCEANGDDPFWAACTEASGSTAPLDRRIEIRRIVEEEAFASFNLSS
jgi:hypothetical protein